MAGLPGYDQVYRGRPPVNSRSFNENLSNTYYDRDMIIRPLDVTNLPPNLPNENSPQDNGKVISHVAYSLIIFINKNFIITSKIKSLKCINFNLRYCS